ncbi:hypothetical protein HRM2_00160 [Desulforapulum autotrophicum HRM2]|uniref:Uncharacterized protein n=2 Tax=Desulforapulum autotrophicum TaxID=2296 RepID=C0QDA1_DESAH|nr:hypothetical protein HRM2_00160 [Desulforapulum autotrophicum HRM2]
MTGRQNQTETVFVFIVCLLLLSFGTMAHAVQASIDGIYKTDFNEMSLQMDGNRITGTYKFKGGKIDGVLQGNILTGTWIQTNAKGRLEFFFAKDFSSFSGKWNYNDATPSKKWNGRKIENISAKIPIIKDIASAKKGTPIVEGVYKTDFSEMSLQLNGNRITGTYKYKGGKIDGVLQGNILTGTWIQTNAKGHLKFIFAEDFSSFLGKWNYNDASLSREWNGNKIESDQVSDLTLTDTVPLSSPSETIFESKTQTDEKTIETAGVVGKPTVPASADAINIQSTPSTKVQISEGLISEKEEMEAFRKLPSLPPLSSMLTTAKASPIAPRLDPGEFSKLQYLGAVSAVKKAMEDLLGPMAPAAKKKFEAQWAAIYDFPADACITYLNAASPILWEILSLRASMMMVIQGYDNFINQAQMARFVGNLEASHELMRRAGQSAALLKSLERKMNEGVKAFAALGEIPDVTGIKAAAAQNYARSKSLLKSLLKPVELSGEYEPAPYQSIQNPLDGGRSANPDHTIIRTEKDDDYDRVTYFQPLKSMGENRVVMYSCETSKEGDKSSFLQMFEQQDNGSFVYYYGGSALTKVVLTMTEDGFQKTEYTLEPKDFTEDHNDFSEQMAALIRKNKLPKVELSCGVRSRAFLANYVQYQKPPTDDEFNWNKWESQLKKHQEEFIEEFEGERLAFETLARQVQFPEPVPAENIYWVLDRMEKVNTVPVKKDRLGVSVIGQGIEAQYMEMMARKDGFTPRPMMMATRETDSSDTKIINVDKRIVFDDADNSKTVRDSLTIENNVSWDLPAPVIPQAGGRLELKFTATRDVTTPVKSGIVPSPFSDIKAGLSPQGLDAQGRYKGYAGDGVVVGLLSEHLNSGPGKITQKSELSLPLDNFFSQTALIELNCGSNVYSNIISLANAGVKFYYKRKFMSQDEAKALSEQMGENLEIIAKKDRSAQDERQADKKTARDLDKENLAALKESMEFHASIIKYEQLKSQKIAQELNREIADLKAQGGVPQKGQQERIAALQFNIISAKSNAIFEQDRINELQTGTFTKTETPFDSMCRVQFRNNIEKNIKKIEFIETQDELAQKYIEFLPEADRYQARKILHKIRDESPDDPEKYQKLNGALKNKWQGFEEAKMAKIDEDLAWKEAQVAAIENIKTGADVGMLACSMFGGPQALALTYQFTTGWAEKDLLTGVKNSVSMYSDAVDIAWSTYDGYCQDGWYGAAKAGGISLLMNKGLPFLVGKMGKGGTDLGDAKIGKTADSLADAAKKADAVKPDIISGNPKLGKPTIDDVKVYKAELENAERQVKGFVTDYHNWKKGVKAGLPDDEIKALHKKMIDSTAAINQNPAAKGYLKYKAPPATGRFFDKSLDQIHGPARQQYYRTMKEAGYSDHEIFAIRNAASSGSTGMDFDQALKEQPDFIPFKNSDGTTSLRRNVWLTKNGKPVSRHQWQLDAQKSWDDAYKNASNGHSAPRSWEKMTSRVDPEAYKQMAVLNISKDLSNVDEIMDSLDPKWVRQMSDVTMFKAGEMLKDKNLSRLAGVREACRGTAKDLDGKFLPFIDTKLKQLKNIEPSKLSPSDKHNMQRLEKALETFTKVKDGFNVIGKADVPPSQWDDIIKKSTGGKGIMQTVQDLSDLTQSLFM